MVRFTSSFFLNYFSTIYLFMYWCILLLLTEAFGTLWLHSDDLEFSDKLLHSIGGFIENCKITTFQSYFLFIYWIFSGWFPIKILYMVFRNCCWLKTFIKWHSKYYYSPNFQFETPCTMFLISQTKSKSWEVKCYFWDRPFKSFLPDCYKKRPLLILDTNS